MNEQDIDIVKRCLKGDGNSFEILVTKYKKKIYNIAYRFTGNKEDALDVTQEVFIKAYNSLNQYDPKYKFSSWILKITTNYCLDQRKRKKVETVELNSDLDNDSTTTSAENLYLHKENKAFIDEAISSLPDKYRVIIVLYHNQNLSYNEISETLKLPLTKVKNRLYRGRNMLKNKLETVRKEETKWTAKKLQY